MTNRDARKILIQMTESRREIMRLIDRKRSMRDSEKAMTKASYQRQIDALHMAVDALRD